jgi:hypothetical protein
MKWDLEDLWKRITLLALKCTVSCQVRLQNAIVQRGIWKQRLHPVGSGKCISYYRHTTVLLRVHRQQGGNKKQLQVSGRNGKFLRFTSPHMNNEYNFRCTRRSQDTSTHLAYCSYINSFLSSLRLKLSFYCWYLKILKLYAKLLCNVCNAVYFVFNGFCMILTLNSDCFLKQL